MLAYRLVENNKEVIRCINCGEECAKPSRNGFCPICKSVADEDNRYNKFRTPYTK